MTLSSYPATISIEGRIDQAVETEARRAIERARRAARPIKLLISSGGGLERPAFNIADDLRAAGGATTAHATRWCSSAAILPYVEAQIRSADWTTEFLLHSGTITFTKDTILNREDVRETLAKFDTDDDRYFSRISQVCRLQPYVLHRMRTTAGLKLSAPAAHALGLVHIVKMPFCDRPNRARAEQLIHDMQRRLA